MKITIESTEKLTRVDGALVRVWQGRTERGVECLVFVARVGVQRGLESAEFERELTRDQAAGRRVFVPLRSIT